MMKVHTEGRSDSVGLLFFVAILVAVVIFIFPLTLAFPLLDPDEGLHASIAQEMVERGNWVVPTLFGQPFLDKPILYFWVQAASLHFFGISETSVRLPGLLFGLLGTITTGLLAWRLFDRRMGLIASILYSTTILPTALAQAASHDVALIPWINLALLMFWEAEHTTSHRMVLRYTIGAGIFLGLSILTKGLTGIAVVGLAYGSYLMITRRLQRAIVFRGMVALTLAGLVASPWYFWVEIHQPGYLRYFFIDRHLMGLVTDMQPHGDQPWWYYLPFLFGGGLPWIGYLPIVMQNRRNFGDDSGVQVLLWSWLIGWTVLITLAGSKLATYLWPAFPPIAILAATAWNDLLGDSLVAAARKSFMRTFIFSSSTGPIVLPAAVYAVQKIYDVRFSPFTWAAVGVVALLTLVPLIPWRRGRIEASLALAALSLAGQFLVVMALILPQVAETCSARLLAEHFNRRSQMPARLFLVEGRIGSLVYYLDPEMRRQLTPDRIQQTLAKELPTFRPGDMIAIQEWKTPKLQKYLDVRQHPYTSIGVYRLYDAVSAAP